MKQKRTAETVLLANHENNIIYNIINDFLSYLLENSFNITINEKNIIFDAIKFIDITSKKEFYALLYSIIIKNSSQIEIFEKLFEMFFSFIEIEEISKKKVSVINDGIVSSYKFNSYKYSSLLNYMVLNSDNNIKRLLHLALSSTEFNYNNKGKRINDIKNRLGVNNIEDEINSFLKELIDIGVSKDKVSKIKIDITQKLKDVKKMIRKDVSINIEKNSNYKKSISINNISYNKIEKSAQMLAEKLKIKRNIKYKKKSRGVIDFKKVVSNSIKYDMIPFERFYKKKIKNNTNLIILSDISDSMKEFSKIMLLFIYALQNSFKNINSFLFISEITEITKMMNDKDMNIAINNVLNNANIDYNSNSDYNSSFEMFNQNYINSIKNNSVVIIIGDAKNNYGFPAIMPLIELRKRVKKIIWLNPTSKFSWGMGDSDMLNYLNIIDNAFSIQTIEDIENFVMSI